MEKPNFEDFKELINQLNKENELYISKIKDLIQHNKKAVNNPLVSYFTYTIDISGHSEKDNLIIGTYHISNQGTDPITNPYICIKFPLEHPFHFSGKILSRTAEIPMKVPDAWERMNNPEDEEEYWLKPVDTIIKPGEKIAFSNFQLKWRFNQPFIAVIHGYAYSDEIKEGNVALNQISIIASEKKGDDVD